MRYEQSKPLKVIASSTTIKIRDRPPPQYSPKYELRVEKASYSDCVKRRHVIYHDRNLLAAACAERQITCQESRKIVVASSVALCIIFKVNYRAKK